MWAVCQCMALIYLEAVQDSHAACCSLHMVDARNCIIEHGLNNTAEQHYPPSVVQ